MKRRLFKNASLVVPALVLFAFGMPTIVGCGSGDTSEGDGNADVSLSDNEIAKLKSQLKDADSYSHDFGSIGSGFGGNTSTASTCLAWRYNSPADWSKVATYFTYVIVAPDGNETLCATEFCQTCSDSSGDFKFLLRNMSKSEDYPLATVSRVAAPIASPLPTPKSTTSSSNGTSSSMTPIPPAPTPAATSVPTPMPEAPSFWIIEKPEPLSNATEGALSVKASRKLDGVGCSLDGTLVFCLQDAQNIIGMRFSNLRDGKHQVLISWKQDTATASGPFSFSFETDATPPPVRIQSSPTAAIVTEASGDGCASFSIYGLDYFDSLWVSIDSGVWTKSTSRTDVKPCLKFGNHSIAIKASDKLGNMSAIQTASWTVLPRFYTETVNGDSVIKNRATGTSSYWLTDVFAKTSYLNAKTGCENLTYAGYSNWYLPTFEEIDAIVKAGIKNFGISGTTYSVWTSTIHSTHNGMTLRWTADLTGSFLVKDPNAYGSETYVRCLRIAY